MPPPPVEGVLTRMIGLTLEAAGCQAAVGDRCDVLGSDGARIEAEVVGFSGDRLYLMPTGDIHGLKPNARVIPRIGAETAAVGAAAARADHRWRRHSRSTAWARCNARIAFASPASPINPLARQPIEEPLDVGIRAINSLLTVGRGQRIGLFAGSGVGKSVLLGMMARYTSAEVIVVGLIGERGREVKEFVERILGPEGRKRSIVVATPADNPPLMRLHGAWRATAIAEYFRDRGKNVLLIMDSLTRFAQAQREIGLAIGEAPATKGYPPSVFARLPQLVERAGNGAIGQRLDHCVLHGADRRRRPAGSDRRLGARDSRRTLRAVAPHRRGRPLSGDRRRSFDQPRHARDRAARAHRARAALQAGAVDVSAEPRPDRDRRLSEGQRSAHRRRHRAMADDAEIPAAGHPRARRLQLEPRVRCRPSPGMEADR